MNPEHPQDDSLLAMDELSGRLRDAVQQVCDESHSGPALENSLRRVRLLSAPADGVEDLFPTSRPSRFSRSLVMTLRIAAMVAATAAAVGLVMWFTPVGATSAFAQVQEALDRARTVAFDATSQVADQPETSARVFVLDAQRVRVELLNGKYMVLNAEDQKSLLVDSQERTAVVMVGRRPNDSAAPADIYNDLRHAHAGAAHELPGKRIRGKNARGFSVVEPQRTMRVWIDPATGLPLRIESKRRRSDGVEIVETADNFVFGDKLDESLFSTDPPAGYSMETKNYPPRADTAAEQPQLVLSPKVGLGPARFGMTSEEVIQGLGQPDDVTSNESGGQTLRYDTRGFWIGLAADGKVRSITCHAHADNAAPVARTFAGKMSPGIEMGASSRQISAALGPPNFIDERASKFGAVTTMTYWDLGLNFSLRDDSLTEIHATLPVANDD